MENFAQELYDISLKYQNSPKIKKIRKATSEIQAKSFLKEIKVRLMHAAEQGKFELPILQVEYSKQSVEQLNKYETLIFEGCKAMGLKTEVRELYETEMGNRESIGFHIYVHWRKE
ncbi:hypothetical protein IPJ63_02640 [Candidatus Nomurabacteria bacterium]|nr:MAG: hypothetical protein IPJ63_02640 [Candidatus Nomurabacteria bacterium]